MIQVGETLKEARKKKGLTLEQVAKATKIRPSFLEAIENGDYSKLPGSSYAHGFVKNYLEFLELPVPQYLARFRREYDEEREKKLIPEGLSGKEISLQRFSLTQAVWGGGLIIILLLAYLLFQYRAAFWPPLLSIDSPKENSVVVSQTVLVTGTTDSNVAVTINNLPAYVDQNGKFSKDLPVFPGNVTIIVKAVNNFGKVAEIDRHVVIKQ